MKTNAYFRLATLATLLLLAQATFAQNGNYFAGTDAGSSNTTGSANTFVGEYAGPSNTTGAFNTFLGYASGNAHSTGTFNTFLGYGAGYSHTTGHYNAFIGASAGSRTTTGYGNTYVGNNAGVFNSTGFLNAFVGMQAGENNTTGDNSVFLGHQAGFYNTSGRGNVFLGSEAAWNNLSGTNIVAVGRQAGITNTTGSSNVFVGTFANASQNNLTYANAIGHRAYVGKSYSLVLGSISGANGASGNTNVGIGTHAPAYRLHVNSSNAAKIGGGTWVVASDQRLKKDITAFTDGLDVLLQIKPVTFRYNGKAGIETDKQFVGVIAQEMQQIAPYTVGEFTYQDTTGKEEKYLDYDANALTYMLVNAVKEQQKQVETLRSENQTLKQELVQIKQVLSRLSPEGNASAARLDQNRPNPSNRTTVIGYFIPDHTTSAQLQIFSVKGQKVYSQELVQKGEGEVVLSTEILPAGTYIYHLVVDNKRVDNKKMVLIR